MNRSFKENPPSSGGVKRIIDLKQGESWIKVKGRVLETGEVKRIETRRGPRTISEAVIGDESGRIKVTLWGDKAGSLKKGEVVEIDGAWTTAYRGEVQLNAGSKTKITELEDTEAPSEDEIPNETPKAPNTFRRGFGQQRMRRRW